MSDTSGPRYTINSLPDFRFELRRNDLVMGFYGSYEQAQLAIQQIDAEVAHSGWSMPPSPNPMALEAKALEAARLSLHGAVGVDALSTVIRAYLAALPLPAVGEGLEPVAWRWRWSKLGRNTAWHFSPEKPGPFAEEGYEVQPLYAATPSARAAVLEEAAQVAEHADFRSRLAIEVGASPQWHRIIPPAIAAAIRALKEKT